MKSLSQICATQWLEKYSEIANKLYAKYSKLDSRLQNSAIIVGACAASSVIAMLTKFGKDGEHADLFKALALFLTVTNTAISSYQKNPRSFKSKAVSLQKLADKAVQTANKLESGDKFDYGNFLEICRVMEADLRNVDSSPFEDGLIETMVAGKALNDCVSLIDTEAGGPT